jgi:hypothetical protein
VPTDERRRAIVAQRRPTTICFPCLIFLSVTDDVALQPVYQPALVRRKHGETNFLFFISHPALIDAILLTGIAFRQIR